jgi:hypothetical protein
MSPPNRRGGALLLLTLHLTGCAGWRPVEHGPALAEAPDSESRVEARITLMDGIQIHLFDSFVRGDSIFGRPRGTDYQLGVPLLDVAEVEVRPSSTARTGARLVGFTLVFGVLLLGGAVFAVWASQSL